MGNFMAIPLETVVNYLLERGSDSNSAGLYDIAMEDPNIGNLRDLFPGVFDYYYKQWISVRNYYPFESTDKLKELMAKFRQATYHLVVFIQENGLKADAVLTPEQTFNLMCAIKPWKTPYNMWGGNDYQSVVFLETINILLKTVDDAQRLPLFYKLMKQSGKCLLPCPEFFFAVKHKREIPRVKQLLDIAGASVGCPLYCGCSYKDFTCENLTHGFFSPDTAFYESVFDGFRKC